jgi:hypothetical protein
VSFEEKEARVFTIAHTFDLTLALFLYPEQTKVTTRRLMTVITLKKTEFVSFLSYSSFLPYSVLKAR